MMYNMVHLPLQKSALIFNAIHGQFKTDKLDDIDDK